MRSHAKAPSAASVRIAGVAVLGLALAFMALLSAPALAAVGHSVLRTFSTGPNSGPRKIATDSAGNVYVVEQEAGRIAKFDAAGNPVAFSASADYVDGNRIIGSPSGLFPEFYPWHNVGIAVDKSGGPDDGHIYLLEEREGGRAETYVYDSTGAYLGRLGTETTPFCGLAVNPTDGSVYLSGYSEGVVRFAAPGSDPASATPAGKLQALGCSIGVDNSSAVYLGDGGLQKYDASQFGSSSPVVTNLDPSPAPALAIAPASGAIYADLGNQIVARDAAGVQQGAAFGQLSDSRGVTTGDADSVLATDAAGGVFVFAPTEVQLPSGSTGNASGVTPDSATVEGTVDPDGAGTITGCEFRYGEDSGYSAGAVPCTPAAPIGSPTAVSANLTGLISGVTYHYRLFVTNPNGTQMSTGDQTFSTPPATTEVSTQPATEVKKDGALLNGSYTGDGQDVHYFFEWGKTNAYGHTTPIPPGDDAGTASGSQNVAPIQISGLRAATAYHYRLVVSTASGITRGQDASFVTASAVTNLTVDPPTGVTDTSAELHASFDGDSTYETHYYFEWGLTAGFGNTTPAPPGTAIAPGSGRINVPAVPISGLTGGSTYHYRVIASNSVGRTVSAEGTFKTAEAPQVGNLNSRNLQATSAELVAQVNPRYGATTFHFDWGPTAGYGNKSPAIDPNIGSGNSPITVTTQLTGLSSGVTYHFRLVATNQYGTSATPDQTFGFYPGNCPNAQLRQETRSNDLPDCRAYELVTPSFAQGAFIYPLGGPAAPLASSPSRIAYSTAFGTFSAEAGDPSNTLGDLAVSTRTDTGWRQKYVGRSATETLNTGGPPVNHEENFDQQGLGPARAQVGAQASPGLDQAINYDRGWADVPGQRGHASNAPYVWDTSSGALIGRWPTNLSTITNGDDFVGRPEVSEDFNHFVFQSNLIFAEGGTEVSRTITCCEGGMPPNPPASIYDNDIASGTVRLASIEGDDKTTFEGYVLDVSSDGSRILMSKEAPGGSLVLAPGVQRLNDIKGPLYLRVEGRHTVEIAAGRNVTYVGGTADGKTIYLRSAERLTADDHDSSTDLYAWHEEEPNALTLISLGNHGDAGDTDSCSVSWNGGGCNVEVIDFIPYSGLDNALGAFGGGQGGNGYTDSAIASSSGDIYFISPEQLLEGKGEEGQANLYVYRKGDLSFVASLTPQAVCTNTGFGSGCSAGPIARMQVTPDGKHMAFVSTSNITGYDSAERTEMYTYDPETGRITCASCRPDGKAPIGEVFASQNGLFQTYDGRVFFSTEDPLVPRDTNGAEDIYEYSEGKAQLISTGVGPAFRGDGLLQGTQNTTGLVSVSANGTDVYFASIDSLVTQDHNGASLKIYDARTGGGFPAERTPAKCAAADECHGAGASPPVTPPDRTSASLGKPNAPKHHKAKRHHKKKTAQKRNKKVKKRGSGKHENKRGRSHRG